MSRLTAASPGKAAHSPDRNRGGSSINRNAGHVVRILAECELTVGDVLHREVLATRWGRVPLEEMFSGIIWLCKQGYLEYCDEGYRLTAAAVDLFDTEADKES